MRGKQANLRSWEASRDFSSDHFEKVPIDPPTMD
jgi:predicted RNA-binding Zn-ribbon protein involved in translation (DUF1610 family)